MDVDTLVQRILSGSVQGFVVLKNGRETANDKLSHLFSFIPQRARVRESEIGQVTRTQLACLYGDKADSKERAIRNTYYTMTKSYVDSDSAGVLCMSTTLFSWLYRERKFRHFDIIHFIQYRFRDWTSTYLRPMLDERQKVKEKIEQGQDSFALMSAILKLLSNAMYGYLSMNATNYDKTTVKRAVTIERNLKDLPTYKNVSLVGSAPKRNAPKRRAGKGGGGSVEPSTDDQDRRPDMELLYAVSQANDQAKVLNLLQQGSAILSNSKVMFFDKIAFILRHCSIKRLECAYLDTDSMLASTEYADLRDCVEKKMLPSFDEGIDRVIYNPERGGPSHGLFKREFLGTRFLSNATKAYYISNKECECEEGECACGSAGGTEVKRFKGCSRSVQEALGTEHFDLDGATGLSKLQYANRTRLGATAGFQMCLTQESKRLIQPISVKRRFDVSFVPGAPASAA